MKLFPDLAGVLFLGDFYSIAKIHLYVFFSTVKCKEKMFFLIYDVTSL